MCATTTVHAAVIDFETVTKDPIGAFVPNGYAGFNWSGLFALNKNFDTSVQNGYTHATTSGMYSISNWGNGIGSFERDTIFSLVSMQLTKPHAIGNVHLEGWRGSERMYYLDVPATPFAPTLAQLNWAGITKVRVLNDSVTVHTAIDDIVIANVPEPSQWALLGIAGLAFAIARGELRRRAST